MDGFRENEKIIVVAATNRVLCLDDALLRSGRFDTKIKVELPNEEERFGIVKLHLSKVFLFFKKKEVLRLFKEKTKCWGFCGEGNCSEIERIFRSGFGKYCK